MNRIHLSPRALVPAVLLLALGCGSGGATAEVTLSALNAEALASQGVGAIEVLDGMSGIVENFSGVFSNPAAQTIPCSSGNLSISVNDAAPQGQVSTGDSASFAFNGCVIQIGEQSLTLNGTLAFEAVEVSGTAPGPFTVAWSASFDALTVVLPGGTVVADGGFALEISSADGETLSSIVSGEYFSAFAQAGDQVFSGWLKDFRRERTLDVATGDYLVDLDATIYSSELGGTAVFETTDPFVGTLPYAPDAGSFVVTGAEGATLTLETVDSIDVRILVDADADGNAETTIDTTWAVLGGS